MKKDPEEGTLPKMYTGDVSPSLPWRDLQPFTRETVPWRKGNNQIFWRLLDTGSELTLVPRDPNVSRAHHTA